MTAKKARAERLLLVCYHFPPCNMVAALRSYSFAKYLAAAGYRVTVLAMDLPGGGDATLDCGGFEVVRVAGRKNLQNIGHYAQNELGSADSGIGRRLAARFLQGAALVKNLCIGNLLTPEDGWFFQALRSASRLLAEREFEVVITSHGPISAHLVGLLLKRSRPEFFWIADYRDPWSNNANFRRPAGPLRALQNWVETRINRACDHLVTVSHPLLQDYFDSYRDKATVIENGYLPEDYLDDAEAAGTPGEDDAFVCAHTGTFYQASYKLAPLLEAVRDLVAAGAFSRRRFELRFYGNNACDLRQALNGQHPGVLKVFDGVPRRESLRIQRRADALLFLSSDDVRYRGVYSSKIFEYLASGTPIVVVGNGPDNAAALLVERAGAGFVCGSDPAKIADAFRKIAAGEIPARNDQVVAAFSRERLANKLIALIEGRAAQHQ